MEITLMTIPQTMRMSNTFSDNKVHPVSALDKPCTVLYVEDHADNLALVGEILARRCDLKFIAAATGLAGLALAREHKPDVILMDINMPTINGFAVLQMLLEDPVTAEIPVVALSSDAYPKQIEKGIAAGFFGYMTKPFVIKDLEAALEVAIAYSIKKKSARV